MQLIAGANAQICDECVGLCVDAINEKDPSWLERRALDVVEQARAIRARRAEEEYYTLPAGYLSSAEELAASMRRHDYDVSAEELRALAQDGFLPHLRTWRGEMRFHDVAVSQWFREHTQVEPGRAMPRVLALSVDVPLPTDVLPSSLALVASQLRTFPQHACGVYFLIRERTIVYVGQSVRVGARIHTHRDDSTKCWDFACYLPLPRSALDEVEAAFICALRPEYNTQIPAPPECRVFAKYGLRKPEELVADGAVAERTT